MKASHMKASQLKISECGSFWFGALLVAIATVGAVICPAAFAEDEDVLKFDLKARVWTDTTGEYRLNAALVGYQNRELILRKGNGDEIQISVDKLSREDREFVANRLREARRNRQPQLTAERESEPKPVTAERARPIVLDNSIRAQQMYGIDWYNTNDILIVASANDDKNQKPVMWLRVLGDLSGFM